GSNTRRKSSWPTCGRWGICGSACSWPAQVRALGGQFRAATKVPGTRYRVLVGGPSGGELQQCALEAVVEVEHAGEARGDQDAADLGRHPCDRKPTAEALQQFVGGDELAGPGRVEQRHA